MTPAIRVVLLLALAAFLGTAHAQTGDKCKICRDYDAACVKAHSKEACKSELNVCLKHCRAQR